MTLLALRDHEMTTLGAASIVGRSLGWYEDDREASAALLAVEQEHAPNPAHAGLYDQQFSTYVELAARLTPMFRPAELTSNAVPPSQA